MFLLCTVYNSILGSDGNIWMKLLSMEYKKDLILKSWTKLGAQKNINLFLNTFNYCSLYWVIIECTNEKIYIVLISYLLPFLGIRGVQKCKILDSELAVWVFPWFGVSETTKKNFSSLAYLECPPLMAFQYTKEIQKNTKEKSWNIIFQFFAQKTILLTFLRLPAAFLRSQRFFWHPYRHKWMFSCHRTLCVIYVIYGIYDINDTLAFDINHD